MRGFLRLAAGTGLGDADDEPAFACAPATLAWRRGRSTSASRSDILVGPEDVVRVVSRLERRQPIVGGAVGSARADLAFVAEEIDVHAAGAERRERVEGC